MSRTDTGLFLLFTALATLASAPVSAQQALPLGAWTQVEDVQLNTADAHENFWTGRHVDLDGDTLVFSGGLGAEGAVYVFVRNGDNWIEQARIRPEPLTGACALSGDTLVVGAYTNEHAGYQSGAAYVYERSNGSWSQVAMLAPADVSAQDRFGFAVDVDGDRAVVGAPRSIPGGPGKAYVYSRASGWSQGALLTLSGPTVEDHFGEAVSVDGDRIAIGAPEHLDDGACLVYRADGASWTLEEQIVSGEPTFYFGFDVALSASTLAVSTYESGLNSVQVFTRSSSGWSEEAVLEGGWSGHLSLQGDRLLVSTPSADEGRPGAGSAHLYERRGQEWLHAGRFVPTDPDRNSLFGFDVALDRGTAVMGAFRDNSYGLFSGAVYVYELFAGSASNYCEARRNSSDVAARMALSGRASLGALDFELRAVGAPTGAPGRFVYGFARTNVPFGNGTLCVSQLGRFAPLPLVAADELGSASFELRPTDLPPGLMPSTLYFQFVFRDVTAGGALLDSSDGLAVRFEE